MEVPRRRTGFKRRAALIVVLTGIAVGGLLLFGVQSVQRIQAVEKRWADYSQNAAEAGRLLHDISRQLGYGGYIHNFKNYVLRRDLEYVATLVNNRDAVYADLDALERHVISDEEKAALIDIRNVFEKYANGVPIAAEAFSRGLSSVEVDILVRVDDTPALSAIAALNHSFLMRTRLAESETNKAMKAASFMVWVLIAMVPVIAVLGVILILFLRRIMDANFNLAEVRDELSMLLRQAPDAILHVGGDGKVLRANDRALALFNYPREELLNKSVEDLIPGRYRSGHVGIREHAFQDMSSRPIGEDTELFALTKDGHEVPVDISLNFSLSGGRRIATAIIRDVTERKRAEEELKHAHDELELRVRERTIELEQRTGELEAEISERKRAETQLVQSAKMATIGEMASGITHELNQPMNIMRMGVEAAQIRIERGQADMEYLGETLQKVEGQILRMSDIINHMRVYSRQDAEGQAPFDPYQAIREGCKLFEAQLSGVNVELTLSIPEGVDSKILGHGTRLEQVMLNLLSNARDAALSHKEQAEEGFLGRISVTTEQNDQTGVLQIRVEDNGGGIPEEVLPHIFAPFVTTKESGRGTGLGLSISYGIIEGMHGTIEATNTEVGACFEIALPLVGAETEGDVVPRHEPDEGLGAPEVLETLKAAANTVKILVVDDEMTAAHSLSDFLQETGYLVYTAYNGEEAIQIYESDPTDAVITDLRMPVMDGEELIRQLRVHSKTLPIFAMTGHDLPGDGENSLAQGATELWRKPISLGDVAQRLKSSCGPAFPKD